jgi:hypothetical protein
MAKSFGASCAKSAKTDNARHGRSDKIAIRRAVLAEIASPVVFDGFAGSGVMFRSVWRGAYGYVGCDLRYFRDERTAFVADNRRVLRSIDLAPFNIFDFDAYGGPWEQCLIVADRRKVLPGERIGLCLTEGSRLKMTFGGMPKLLAYLADVSTDLVGANRDVGFFVDRALDGLCDRWGVGIVKQWRAESKSIGQARPLYIGLVLEGLSGAAARATGCDSRLVNTAGDHA